MLDASEPVAFVFASLEVHRPKRGPIGERERLRHMTKMATKIAVKKNHLCALDPFCRVATPIK